MQGVRCAACLQLPRKLPAVSAGGTASSALRFSFFHAKITFHLTHMYLFIKKCMYTLVIVKFSWEYWEFFHVMPGLTRCKSPISGPPRPAWRYKSAISGPKGLRRRLCRNEHPPGRLSENCFAQGLAFSFRRNFVRRWRLLTSRIYISKAAISSDISCARSSKRS